MPPKPIFLLLVLVLLALSVLVTVASAKKGTFGENPPVPVQRTFENFQIHVPSFWACHSEPASGLTGAMLEMVTLQPDNDALPVTISVLQLAKPDMTAKEFASLGPKKAFNNFRKEPFNPDLPGLPTLDSEPQIFKGLESHHTITPFDLFGPGAGQLLGISVIKGDKLLSVSYCDGNASFKRTLPIIESIVSSLEFK